jgi:hypothetical protein
MSAHNFHDESSMSTAMCGDSSFAWVKSGEITVKSGEIR